MKLKIKNLSHLEKALIISLIIELILIVLLFRIGFKEKIPEQTYSVDFIDDDFDFNELKPKEEIKLPDISDALHNKINTNRASNMLQEDKSFEEFRKQQEEAIKTFEEKSQKLYAIKKTENHPSTDKNKAKEEKRFTGRSHISYYIKNRKDIYIANPLYTCPDNMKGLIAINIEVNKEGNVIKAQLNKDKSTSKYQCLIDTAIQAAYESYFNSDDNAPEVQKGIITYDFY